MSKEILNYSEHPEIKENYRGFDINAFGSEWQEKNKEGKISKHSEFDAIIYDYHGIKTFQLRDDGGEKIRSVKNALNVAKKCIDRSIDNALATRVRISNFNWNDYIKRTADTIEENQKKYAEYYRGYPPEDPTKINWDERWEKFIDGVIKENKKPLDELPKIDKDEWIKRSIKSIEMLNESKAKPAVDPNNLDLVSMKKYVIGLDIKDLESADRILGKVPKEDHIWENYVLPIPWFI